ncbi:MAG TPA: hypothetical protein VMC62_01780 [Longilinea sp.]|nr:hypothetical protein [Longilinea sp.]
MTDLLDKLTRGDLRSIGRSQEVVDDVLADPPLFDELVLGMLHAEPVVRMRAADAVEKVTRLHPEWLQAYKTLLIEKIALLEQPEVRWHVCQLLPRLELTATECQMVMDILDGYLSDKSSIVKTFTMQALADFAIKDVELRSAIIQKLETLTTNGTPAMKSRGKKLLKTLKRE